MKTKRWLSVVILASLLSGTSVFGQDQPVFPPPSPTAKNGELPILPEFNVPSTGGLSDWISYKRDCCEGKPGAVTPLFTEVYLNSGATIPIGGATLTRELKTGWSITGGGRALFFNEPLTSAWVVDVHITNTNESAGQQNTQFPITFFQNGTRSDQVVFQGNTGRTTFSLQNANRTMVGLGLGREWYLFQPADAPGFKWRVGADFGGRYGSLRVNFNEFGHNTDVVGSTYVAVHSDLEYLWHGWLFHAGARLEWAYVWSDVLQQTSDVQDISLLFSMGVRF